MEGAGHRRSEHMRDKRPYKGTPSMDRWTNERPNQATRQGTRDSRLFEAFHLRAGSERQYTGKSEGIDAIWRWK